jgi:uncharacterized protein (DUF433 family)
MARGLLTRLEAAACSGASPTLVKKAVDQRVIPATRGRSQLGIEPADVGVLAMLHLLAGLRLPVEHKRRVRRWLRAGEATPELALGPAVAVRRVDAVDDARRRAERYVELRDTWIVRDPEIKAGEPVIRGSRVGVHTLAERIARGESNAALDEDLPHIPREARDIAVQFACANPRRGRPTRG